jgi:hypothetical protein
VRGLGHLRGPCFPRDILWTTSPAVLMPDPITQPFSQGISSGTNVHRNVLPRRFLEEWTHPSGLKFFTRFFVLFCFGGTGV